MLKVLGIMSLCEFISIVLLAVGAFKAFYITSNPEKPPYVAFSMQIPASHIDQGIGTVPQSAMTPNWIINVSDVSKQDFRVAINSGVLFIIWILVVKNMLFFLDCGMQNICFWKFSVTSIYYLY
jgi:hypothetical protein